MTNYIPEGAENIVGYGTGLLKALDSEILVIQNRGEDLQDNTYFVRVYTR